jgi:dTDP-4-dehydrorhamnose reductase
MAGHLGLFEFVRGAKDTIKGFVNHRWNGMTTLQYAKVCDRIMNDGLWVDGVRHVFSNSVSKYELVSTIDDVFGFDKNIIVHEAAERIDRTLSSSFDLCSKMTIPSVEDQLREIAEQASHDAE